MSMEISWFSWKLSSCIQVQYSAMNIVCWFFQSMCGLCWRQLVKESEYRLVPPWGQDVRDIQWNVKAADDNCCRLSIGALTLGSMEATKHKSPGLEDTTAKRIIFLQFIFPVGSKSRRDKFDSMLTIGQNTLFLKFTVSKCLSIAWALGISL